MKQRVYINFDMIDHKNAVISVYPVIHFKADQPIKQKGPIAIFQLKYCGYHLLMHLVNTTTDKILSIPCNRPLGVDKGYTTYPTLNDDSVVNNEIFHLLLEYYYEADGHLPVVKPLDMERWMVSFLLDVVTVSHSVFDE